MSRMSPTVASNSAFPARGAVAVRASRANASTRSARASIWSATCIGVVPAGIFPAIIPAT